MDFTSRIAVRVSSSEKLIPLMEDFIDSHEFPKRAAMRTKFEGEPTSIAFEIVATLGRGV